MKPAHFAWSTPSLLVAAAACSGSNLPPPVVAPPALAASAPAPPSPAPPVAEPAQTRYAPDVEQRIERVMRGLLPETEIPTRFAPPATIAERLAHYHTPGVGVAVIHGGKVEWARGFGVRDVEGGQPVTEETVFQAGSISKPVFALAVMKLVAAGKLSLDEDVNRYLASWKVPAQRSFAPRITLRQILSHSSGLSTHGFLGYLRTEPLPTVPQILDGAPPANSPAVRVNLLPGVRFRYSGGGITVAQLAVTDLLGKPFPDLMDDLVLHPLGLTHSTYAQPLPDAWHARAATAYPWKAQPVPGRWHAEATFYEEIGEGAVVMLNSNEGEPLQGEILRAIAREYAWPDYFPEERAVSPKAAAPPASLDGTYETEKGARFVVQHREGRFELVAPGQPPVELRAEEDLRFFVPDLDAEVAFHDGGKKGGVDRLVIEQEGVSVEAKRK